MLESTTTTENQEDEEFVPLGSCTYSIEDNKLRFTPNAKLSDEEYTRAKEAGFVWAPGQKIFICPRWTPKAEDLMLEWCGEVEDEMSTMEERAAARSARFENRAEARARDAENAQNRVHQLTDGIPLGQPILVGHHSERHARRIQKRVEQAMDRSVENWKLSSYWERRAVATKAHASYKADPGVRTRRIRTLEAELRKIQKEIDKRATAAKWFTTASTSAKPVSAELFKHALWRLEVEWGDGPFHKAAAEEGADIKALCAKVGEKMATPSKTRERWVAHLNARIGYERAVLRDDNALVLDAENWDIAVGGMVLAREKWWSVTKVTRGAERKIRSVTGMDEKGRRAVLSVEFLKEYKEPDPERAALAKQANKVGPIVNVRTEGCRVMSSREWKELSDSSGLGFWIVKVPNSEEHGAHRVRRWHRFGPKYERLVSDVFIEDMKEVPVPPPGGSDVAAAKKKLQEAIAPSNKVLEAARPAWSERERSKADLAMDKAEELQAAGTVQVVVADQLFPTPPAVCERVKDVVFNWDHGQDPARTIRMLEPSVGTWKLVKAVSEVLDARTEVHLTTVEIDQTLFDMSRALSFEASGKNFAPVSHLVCHLGDFLQLDVASWEPFDLIVMNPPFKDGIDVKHMTRARLLLKPGGLLVAICAGGPRQEEFVRSSGAKWEHLPKGSFMPATNVNTIIAAWRA